MKRFVESGMINKGEGELTKFRNAIDTIPYDKNRKLVYIFDAIVGILDAHQKLLTMLIEEGEDAEQKD